MLVHLYLVPKIFAYDCCYPNAQNTRRVIIAQSMNFRQYGILDVKVPTCDAWLASLIFLLNYVTKSFDQIIFYSCHRISNLLQFGNIVIE